MHFLSGTSSNANYIDLYKKEDGDRGHFSGQQKQQQQQQYNKCIPEEKKKMKMNDMGKLCAVHRYKKEKMRLVYCPAKRV